MNQLKAKAIKTWLDFSLNSSIYLRHMLCHGEAEGFFHEIRHFGSVMIPTYDPPSESRAIV